MKRLALLVLVLFAGALSAQEKTVEQIPGDINRDGTVDFRDFVELAKNFGKTGPPPTEVKPDTVKVEVIVRDTVRITEVLEVPGPSARVQRAQRMFGYWTFYWATLEDHYLFGHTFQEDETDKTKEVLYSGVSDLGTVAFGRYNTTTREYGFLHRIVEDGQLYYYGFDWETGKGAIYLIDGDDSFKINDFKDGSGRKPAYAGFKQWITAASKVIPQTNQGPAPPEVIAEAMDLQRELEAMGVMW